MVDNGNITTTQDNDMQILAEVVSELESEATITTFPSEKKLSKGIVLNRLRNKKSLTRKDDIVKNLLGIGIKTLLSDSHYNENNNDKNNEMNLNVTTDRINNDGNSKMLLDYNNTIEVSLSHINDNEETSKGETDQCDVRNNKDNKVDKSLLLSMNAISKEIKDDENEDIKVTNINQDNEVLIKEQIINCNELIRDDSKEDEINNKEHYQLFQKNMTEKENKVIEQINKDLLQKEEGVLFKNEAKNEIDMNNEPTQTDIEIELNKKQSLQIKNIKIKEENVNAVSKTEESITINEQIKEKDLKKITIPEIKPVKVPSTEGISNQNTRKNKNKKQSQSNEKHITSNYTSNSNKNRNPAISNKTKTKPFAKIDHSFGNKSTQLEASFSIKQNSQRKPILKITNPNKKHQMNNKSVEINSSQFHTIPTKSTTKTSSTISKPIQPTTSMNKYQMKSPKHQTTTKPKATIQSKPTKQHQVLFTNPPIYPIKIKSPKKLNYTITKKFLDRQKSFLKRIDAKKKKLSNEIISKEAKELNIIGAKCNKKLTNDYIKHHIDQMNEWEHKRLEHIEELKKSLLNESKENEEEKECKSFKRRKQKLHSVNYTEKDISEVCNRLYKEEQVKRKEKSDYLQKIFQPTFTPMLNSFKKNIPRKKAKRKSKPFRNISMNSNKCNDENKHKAVNYKKRGNLSQDVETKIELNAVSIIQ